MKPITKAARISGPLSRRKENRSFTFMTGELESEAGASRNERPTARIIDYDTNGRSWFQLRRAMPQASRPVIRIGLFDRLDRFMLTWPQSEFLLKGVYLGLIVMIAWLMPTWAELALIAGIALLSLLLFLGTTALLTVRQGLHIRGRWLGFILFLLLECPGAVYAGLIIGLSAGALVAFELRGPDGIPADAAWPVLGGAILGGIFYNLRGIPQPKHRFALSLALLAVLVGGAIAFFYFDWWNIVTED